MRKLALALALSVLSVGVLSVGVYAEPPNPGGGDGATTACSDNEIWKAASSIMGCSADADTGGAPSFDAVTTGTNTTSAMTCNVGCTIAGSGALTMVPATATALAANGANCSAGSYPLGVDDSGAAETCTDASAEIDSILAAGNAATATALAANGADCSAGSYPLGVDASGAAAGCTDASTETDSIVATHTALGSAHHAATTDTGPDPDCSGTTTYQDGEGGCDDISGVYAAAAHASTHEGSGSDQVSEMFDADDDTGIQVDQGDGDDDTIRFDLGPLGDALTAVGGATKSEWKVELGTNTAAWSNQSGVTNPTPGGQGFLLHGTQGAGSGGGFQTLAATILESTVASSIAKVGDLTWLVLDGATAFGAAGSSPTFTPSGAVHAAAYQEAIYRGTNTAGWLFGDYSLANVRGTGDVGFAAAYIGQVFTGDTGSNTGFGVAYFAPGMVPDGGEVGSGGTMDRAGGYLYGGNIHDDATYEFGFLHDDCDIFNTGGRCTGAAILGPNVPGAYTFISEGPDAAKFEGGVELGDAGTLADPADTGAIRLDNAASICWESSPAGTDVCLQADSSEVIGVTGGTFDAVDMTSDRIAGSTYSTVQDMQTIFHSAGWTSGGVINDAGGGNITVDAGTGLVRTSDSQVAALEWFDWSALGSTAITADSVRYVGVEYNGGSPQVVVHTSYDWDFNTDFPLGNVVNEGGTLHIETAPHAVGDHANFMIQRMYATAPLARDDRMGGLILGETGTRNVTLTTGTLWERLQAFSIASIDTSVTGGFDTYCTTTKEASGATQWPNGSYCNAGTLTGLNTNRYAVLWFYIELDGGLMLVYGNSQYTSLAAAENEAMPTALPDRVSAQSILVGRFVFQDGDATALSIESAFTAAFAGSLTSDHGNLAGLSDDDHPQYLQSVDGTDIALGSDAQGDVMFYNGSSWARLAAGTSGWFLSTQGPASDPVWAAGGGLANVVEDTTPQLGGHLDVNGQDLGDGTLEVLSFVETGSAVNEFTITNAATTDGPILSATGGDTDIDINITPKGTGSIRLNGPVETSSSPAPGMGLRDSNAVESPITSNHLQLTANLTDTGDGDEDTDGTLDRMISGVLAAAITWDADGPDLYDGNGQVIRLGDVSNYMEISDAGVVSFGGTGAMGALSVAAGAYAAASIDGDDVNSNIAGRSLTLTGASPDTLDVDAELLWAGGCYTKIDPATDEEFYTQFRAPTAITITELYCEVTGGTSVLADLEIDDGTPTGVNGSDITCTTSGVADSTLAGDVSLADGDRLDIDLGTVTGSVTQFTICWEGTIDD